MNLYIRQAVQALRAGGVIAYPTEAVWGLGCDPWNASAFARLLEVKQRPPEKGVILAAANLEQIAPLLVGLNEDQMQMLQATWPGPNTWIMSDPEGWIPDWIKGKHNKVAVRVSNHPLVRELCQAWDGPLVSTSANPSGVAPARSRLRLQQYFGYGLDAIVPGALGGQAQPSRIRDLVTGTVLR
ncbi:Sua5/YciO/YrdC/YwlC family protein [Pokkaliibacter sp. MBI-7]|uniref:L-threonylcarbamoyladenylate synthase n=1 Tax=Proteobacteria bacterium 228 TaxID=2083153 RepID=A0A2S5KTH0_9PROT|nr:MULTISPECIES: Sua5/YciO/YrdC/YwlC family protein [Pokkaliibacter]MDH2433167.1 Sua5/YciO/YrdC/YwlC family protein [Pokkaliibacter sp. MBI-7]PPC78050.1 tRNA threonylcarbamoyladenosine biosynthesis protein RimN [Pokkaliibacter plantistimulans]